MKGMGQANNNFIRSSLMSKHIGQEIKQTDHVYWFVTHWLWIWNESADQLCFAHLWFMLIANFKRMIPASKHVNACSHLNLSVFVHLCVIQKGSLEHGSSVSLHHKAPQCHSELSGRRRIDWRQLEKTCKEKIDIRWILELAKICSCITVKLKTLKSIWIDTGETIESTLLNAHSKRILSTAISIKMSFLKQAGWYRQLWQHNHITRVDQQSCLGLMACHKMRGFGNGSQSVARCVV